jgi:hypothetical protein
VERRLLPGAASIRDGGRMLRTSRWGCAWHDVSLRIVVPLVVAVFLIPTSQWLNAADQPGSGHAPPNGKSPSSPESADTSALRHLAAIWQGQQTDIQTARLKFRSVRLFPPFLKADISRAKFDAAMSATDLASHPEQLRNLVKAFAIDSFSARTQPWTDKEFVLEGARRAESTNDSRQIVDGDLFELSTKVGTRRQIDLQPKRTGLYTMRLSDFRYVPRADLFLQPLIDGRIRSQLTHPSPGQLSIARATPTGFSEPLLIDEVTGGCIHFAAHAVIKGKRLSREIFQGGFVRYPGGIDFPTYQIKASFDNGTVKRVYITLVLDAHFNEPIPPDRFDIFN